MQNNVPDKWIETGRLLKNRQHPSGKKPIQEMNLEECLEAERKYLRWSDTNRDHPDFTTKKHLYNTYLLPRIELLQFQDSVLENLCDQPVEDSKYQMPLLSK